MNQRDTQIIILSSWIVSRFERGDIFFIEDLIETGFEENALRAYLSILVREGTLIIRLASGIFCYPRLSENGKILVPSVDAVVYALVRRYNLSIAPCKAHAARLAGFPGTFPAPYEFVTDGSDQVINLKSGETIVFIKRKSRRVFRYRSEKLRNLVEGMRHLGPDAIGEREMSVISETLLGISQDDYVHDLKLSPGWVREILEEIRPV